MSKRTRDKDCMYVHGELIVFSHTIDSIYLGDNRSFSRTVSYVERSLQAIIGKQR
jgi:hypothetical protein